MRIFKAGSVALTFFVSLGTAQMVGAVTYFEMNFDGGTVPSGGQPSWALPTDFFTFYLGTGRQFELTDAASHSGGYSLKFNYDGRNGMCNLCGVNSETHKTGVDGSLDFISNAGNDLTQAPYNAKAGRIVINQDNGYSRWAVVSVGTDDTIPNNKLTLKKLADPVNGTPAGFDGGDTVYIALQCGVDGTIGGDVDRRSDCNGAITYFAGISGSQSGGDSLFRRVYLKHTMSTLDVHQKLRYWRMASDQKNAYVVINSVSGIVEPSVLGLQLTDIGGSIYFPGGNPTVGTGMPAGTRLKRDTWYYMEEQLKAESSTDAGDGEYRLWLAEAGTEDVNAPPIAEVTGLKLPPVSSTSLWGNTQHLSHTIGAWYIDDISIQDVRVGPLTNTGANVSPPNHPIVALP